MLTVVIGSVLGAGGGIASWAFATGKAEARLSAVERRSDVIVEEQAELRREVAELRGMLRGR